MLTAKLTIITVITLFVCIRELELQQGFPVIMFVRGLSWGCESADDILLMHVSWCKQAPTRVRARYSGKSAY